MAIKTITSGSGFTTLTDEESPQGAAGATGYDFHPVARWTEPPYSVYREDALHIGLMAYHSEGIKEVEFILNGGTGVKVTDQEVNPYTNLPEYCVRVNRDDLLGATAEGFNNLELRAIVRPVTGQVKVMQHDFMGLSAGGTACRNTDMARVVGGVFGVSGGHGNAFQTKRLRPGTHSFVCSLLQDNHESDGTTPRSALPDLIRYVSVSGDDDTGTGSRELPYKTVQKSVQDIYDSLPTITGREFNNSGDGTIEKFYKDMSGTRIILMAGTHTPENYRVSATLGNGSNSSDPAPICVNTWMVLEGEVDAEGNPATFVTVPEDESEKINPSTGEIYLPEVPSNPVHLNLTGVGVRVGCFNVKNIHFKRNNLRSTQTNVGVVCDAAGTQPVPDAQNILLHPVIQGIWLDNCVVEQENLSQGERSFGLNKVAANLFAATECDYFGGKQNSSLTNWLRNCKINCNVGDSTKMHAFSAGTQATNTQGSILPVRKIWFTPPGDDSGQGSSEDYTKFNGYYAALREADHFKDVLEDSIHDGLQFDANPTGGLWFRIRPEIFNNETWGPGGQYRIETDALTSITDPLDFSTLKYHELGAEHNDEDGKYLPDVNYSFDEMLPYIAPFGEVPLLSRQHGINPTKSRRRYWYGTETTNPESQVGDEIIDQIWDGTVMGCMTVSPNSLDNPTGNTAIGYALFDVAKPLRNKEDSDVTGQRYLWRHSGSFGDEGGNNRAGGTGSFYDKSTSTKSKESPYPYAWATSLTTTDPPQTGNDIPPSEIDGSTNDAYPVWCLGNFGEEDGPHTDMYQHFVNNTWPGGGEIRIENILSAYDSWYNIKAQCWNMDGPGPNFPSESWTDMAWVNCHMVGPVYNAGVETAAWGWPVQNLLLLNNTMVNNGWAFRIGNDLFADDAAGTTGAYGISAGNAYLGIGFDGANYLDDVYGPAGTTFDRMTKNIVFRNNIMSTVVGDLIDIWTNGGGRNDGYTGSTDGIRIENCYFWPYNADATGSYNVMKTAGSSAGGFKELPFDNGYMFKNYPTELGGRNYSPNLQYDYTPYHESGLVGGASGSVPFDIFRTKRVERSTVGAIEPDRLRAALQGAGEFVVPADGGYSTTTKTLSLNSNNEESRFGKLYKVRAVNTDTNQVLTSSDNVLRFENKFDDLELVDASSSDVFEFAHQAGGVYKKSIYTTQFTESADGTEILSTTDWLPVNFGVLKMTIYNASYPSGNGLYANTIAIQFDTEANRTNFHNQITALDGTQVEFTVKDPNTDLDRVLGLSADSTQSHYGGGPFYSSGGPNARYQFNEQGVQGTTVPIGNAQLPDYPVIVTNPLV